MLVCLAGWMDGERMLARVWFGWTRTMLLLSIPSSIMIPSDQTKQLVQVHGEVDQARE